MKNKANAINKNEFLLEKEKLFYITKKLDVSTKNKILIRVASIISALLFCAILLTIFSPGNFVGFFTESFSATFQTTNKFFNTIGEFSILLGISIALLPVFKMKFWNLGAEGQVLMGAFLAGIVSKYAGPYVPEFLTFILMIIAGAIGGAAWAILPGLFKAKFKTNEILFTLMMNYLAMGLILFFNNLLDPEHGQALSSLKYGRFTFTANAPFLPSVFVFIVVAVMAALVFVYLKYTKHGYEISVVGSSENTAKYIGIDTKKVIIRTVLVSGALCGIVGWLFVAKSGTVSNSIVGGRGFTAVLITWLGHFSVPSIALMSFLIAFITRGASQCGTVFSLGDAFSKISIAVFIFVILAFEFFLNYRVNLNHSHPYVIKLKNKFKKKEGC